MLLELRGVSRYFGGLAALDGVNMTVNEGQVVGLIGPNGAGKTTMINNITGLDHPTNGSIVFRDTPIHALAPHHITRLGIARTYQNIRLFNDLTTHNNLMVGQHAQGTASLFESLFMLPRYHEQERAFRERADALLTRFDLQDVAELKAGTLPYGAQRRLEIARALATQPALLLLDEPTAGMNPTETRDVGEQILQLRAEGITVLVIEHDMSLIHQVCDHVYVLNFGQMIAEGTPSEVRSNPQVIEAYLGTEGMPNP